MVGIHITPTPQYSRANHIPGCSPAYSPTMGTTDHGDVVSYVDLQLMPNVSGARSAVRNQKTAVSGQLSAIGGSDRNSGR
jgi:hypothetical protein